jgi:hypothetical protein
MWADQPTKEDDEDEEDDDEEEDEESSDDDGSNQQQEQTREQRKAMAKARKEAAIAKKRAAGPAEPGELPPSSSEEEDEDDMPANPNHTSKARNQASGASSSKSGKVPAEQLSRKEKEALAAQQAKERYQAMHLAGKTEEARADLERLKIIRQQREEAAARKQAEAEEKAELEREKKKQMAEREQKLRDAAMGGSGKRGGKAGKKK